MRILHDSINQGLSYDHRSTKTFQNSVVDEVSRLEGIPAKEIKSWISNINSDFYKFQKDGQEYILKILVSKPKSTINTEYKNLVDLYSISEKDENFTTPYPQRFLPDKSAYISKFLNGTNLAALINSKNIDSITLRNLFYDAGKALSVIHTNWARDTVEIGIQEIIEDFKFNSPWKLNQEESSTLTKLEEKLKGHKVSYCYLYQDYDPVNIVYHGNKIGLIDPPENVLIGPVHWDVGSFIFGIKRATWKNPTNYIFKNKRYELQLISTFLKGYSHKKNLDFTYIDYLLFDLFQLIRLSQLWLWWKTPLLYRRKIFSIARIIYAKPILKKQKNELFNALNK